MSKKVNQIFKNDLYTVIEFVGEGMKPFKCIPDGWFANDEKCFCYWPPISGKSFQERALNKEIPESSWKIEQCSVVSEGHGMI